MEVKNVQLTRADLEQALQDLDNNKYEEERFSTRKAGYKYYCGNGHAVKRMIECAFLNKKLRINREEFNSGKEMRKAIETCGVKVSLWKGDN